MRIKELPTVLEWGLGRFGHFDLDKT